MKRLFLLCGVLSLLGPPAAAIDFYVAPDVPIDLAGVPAGTSLPWTTTRHNTPFTYTTVIAPPLPLPFNTQTDALHRMNSGDWLFSVAAPTTIAGTDYFPEDVVRFSGGLYSLYFCGAPFGVPAGSNLDAVFLRKQVDTGNLVISFDVPTTLFGVTYDPADLIELFPLFPGCTGWAVAGLYFDASAALPPILPSTNVTGADERGATTVLTFDVPTTLAGVTYMPGELVAWDPTLPGYLSLHMDPAWNVAVRANAFSLLAPPGRIPCIPPNKLHMDKGPAAGGVTFFWSASCSTGAEDYGIYEGTLGAWYTHGFVDCTDNGVPFQEGYVPVAGNYYYLVVPHNPNDEGSYGDKSVPPLPAPAERPQGAPSCRPTQELSCQ